MDVAWEVAVSFSCISQSTAPHCKGEVESSLPEAGEADVDEEVGAASGNEKDTDRGDYRRGRSQR